MKLREIAVRNKDGKGKGRGRERPAKVEVENRDVGFKSAGDVVAWGIGRGAVRVLGEK